MNTGHPQIDDAPQALILGSDEVGFGAWAGPLVVAAVAVPRDWTDPRVKDSKKLTERQREAAYGAFKDSYPSALVIVSAEVIDQKGVWEALREAHQDAIRLVLDQCLVQPLIVVDGNLDIPDAVALPKADQLVPAVSLASILAKVTRDKIMLDLDQKYPGYAFAKSKGYGTQAHQAGLERLGPCPEHRRSYEPVARLAPREATDARTIWDYLFEEEP